MEKALDRTCSPLRVPRLPGFASPSVNLQQSVSRSAVVIISGTGSLECIFRSQGVEWSHETAILASLASSAIPPKKTLSMGSMFFFLPTASPSCPNSSGPLMWA